MPSAAFGGKKSKRDENEAAYAALMSGSAQQGTKYMKDILPEYQGQALGAWNNWGRASDHKSITKDNVDELFQSNAELMNDRSWLVSTSNATSTPGLRSGKTVILNEIGNQAVGGFELKSEDRLGHMDDDGNYIGFDQGQVKKRYREEFQGRVAERDKGIEKTASAIEEWESLPKDEQVRRIQEAEENQRRMLETVEMVEQDEVPEAYLFDRMTLDDHPSRRGPQTTCASAANEEDDDHEANYSFAGTGEPLEFNEPARKKVAFTQPTSRPTQARNAASKISSSQSTPFQSPSSGYSTPTESTSGSPGAFHFAGHSRYHDRGYRAKHKHRRPPARPVPPPLPAHHQWKSPAELKALGQHSFFEVSNPKPKMTPPPDVVTELFVNQDVSDETTAELQQLSFESITQPRVVVVQLHQNVKYSSQMLLGKIHGARLQEVQFFPDLKEAVLIFIEPKEAQAFIDHIEAAFKHNDHEFRRLQIAAVWFGGKDRMHGIYPPQKSLLEIALSEKASRAIKVTGLPNDIEHKYLETLLKSMFLNLVGLSIVRPKWNYQKDIPNNTLALLDFTSIYHANLARQSIDNNSLPQLPNLKTEWLTDPCAKPNDRATWCKCLHCKDPNNGVELPPGSAFGRLHGRNAEHVTMAKKDVVYPFTDDLQTPQEFSRFEDRGPMPMERSDKRAGSLIEMTE